jgi:hypothetical protein
MFDRPAHHPRILPLRSRDGSFVTRDSDATGVRDGTPFWIAFDDPQPPYPVNVAWAIDDRAATVASTSPSDRSVYVDPAAGGGATLRAFVGPPVDLEIDAPIYAYRSFAIGCANRSFPTAVRFASDGSAFAEVAEPESDLFVRGSACGTVRRVASAIVAPLGFTFVATRDLGDFAHVAAAAWRAGGTRAAGLATYGTLLTRLHGGGTVKFFMKPGSRAFVDAPYAIAPAGQEFPDVAFANAGAEAPTQTVRRLPESIRIPSVTAAPARADPALDPEIAAGPEGRSTAGKASTREI